MRYLVAESIERMNDLGSTSELQDFLFDINGKLGFAHTAYLGQLPDSDPIPLCTYGNAWVEHYKDANYLAIDPVVAVARNAIVPFEWSTLPPLSKPQRRFFQDAHDFGIGQQGWTCPVRGPVGDNGLIAISSMAPRAEWQSLMQEYGYAIHVLTTYFHDTVIRLVRQGQDSSESPDHLSGREIDCLLWTARGKSVWEISEILNISERTVTFHINNSKLKLNVFSKTHAVVRAIMAGLVRP